ncbi:MAG: cell wall-binding repeat-containing protein [Firmicutes bacterium]|nr:cell wall-binding repeat-containing protein [Bacillota bacterium]
MNKALKVILFSCILFVVTSTAAFANVETMDRSSEFKCGEDVYKYKAGVDYKDGEIVVDFVLSIESEADIYEVAENNSCTAEVISFADYGKCALFILPEGQSVPEAIIQVEKDPRVKQATPNMYFWQETPDDEKNAEEIDRISGATRYDTAIEVANRIKELRDIEKFENIVVAYGGNYPDALSGGYLASVKNAPMLLVNPANETKVEKYIKDNLDSDGTVYILGGETVVSKRFEKKFTNVKRIWGKNRYLTNLEVLKEAGFPKETDNEVMVCTGNGYADSLAASATGCPVLLVNNTLSKEQKKFIMDNHIKWFDVLGDETVVSKSIAKELQEVVFSPGSIHQSVELTCRYAGSDRIGTSIEVAKMYMGEKTSPIHKPIPSAVVLAYANSYADGLAGGVLASELDAPIILIDNKATSIDKVKAYLKDVGIETVYVLGGSSLISDNTVYALK